jgi:NADPH:quinone reductase-like Zn-dependent oxidoreductase
MRAALIDSYGPPEVIYIGEVPTPKPLKSEVLVHVQAVGINPVDLLTRAGTGRSTQDFPLILGWDIAGIVTETGEGVKSLRVGNKVFGMIRFPAVGNACAEYVAAPEEDFVEMPDGVDFFTAASIPMVGLTAWQSLFQIADLKPNHRILIHGAAGGVGHISVQLAKLAGAEVFCTASSSNKEFLIRLGASRVIDYNKQNIEHEAKDIDVAIDTRGGEDFFKLIGTLKAGGIIITLKGRDKAHSTIAKKKKVRVGYTYVKTDRESLLKIKKLMADKKLWIEINRIFKLGEIVSAHKFLEQGHVRGKIAIDMI